MTGHVVPEDVRALGWDVDGGLAPRRAGRSLRPWVWGLGTGSRSLSFLGALCFSLKCLIC